MTQPVLRVVRGDATPEEIAALLVALVAVTPAAGAPRQARSAWADRGALLRRPPAPGPGAWRASALPR
jgi:hypothetical protein